MRIKISDICHIKDYYGKYWVGKIVEINKNVGDYTFSDPILYIFGNDKSNPHFIAIKENELTIDEFGEWWTL